MSTFGGLMVEYPQIAIDRFKGDGVLRAKGYFLSHCHADHMVGLGSAKFAERLKCNPKIKLYCSEVTQEFLLSDPKYSHLGLSVHSLPIEQSTTVMLADEFNGNEEKLVVTLLPAGHCPGSVMFLFEGEQGSVLYTGDFRLAKGEVARLEPLHSGSRVKDVKSVYLDTTFCVPEALHIPSREASKDALLGLVERQITRSPGHMVKLACKAKYGYEFLFVEMSKTFHQKVHVSEGVMKQYERVPELARHLTTDGSSTQIHACRYSSCSLESASDVMLVQPSTMWFTSNARPDDVVRKVGNRYRLCFSFHSSYSEVRDFLGYIRPKYVYPNVVPYCSSEEEVVERLQDLLRDNVTDNGVNKLDKQANFKSLGSLKNIQRINRKRQHSNEEEDWTDLFDSSPELKQCTKKPPLHSTAIKHEDKEPRNYAELNGRSDGSKSDGVESGWQTERRDEGLYGCTFADSDGILSDSDLDEESEDIFESRLNQHDDSIKRTREQELCDDLTIDSQDFHQNSNVSCDSKLQVRVDKELIDKDCHQKGIPGERKDDEDDDDDEAEEDGEVINPSQSSVNEGSIPLFSDDSQGGSQQSTNSTSNWLQYLPHTQKSPVQERTNNSDSKAEDERNPEDGAKDTTLSPVIISDDSDSDVTNICSQRTVVSEDSSVIEVIEIIPH
ncbi:protein artemis-like [Diadema setosum]|uniref:protein artemis-like n=1 Tax=Diadema setosum TaxID=31175 RepID=UPI003B3BBEFB